MPRYYKIDAVKLPGFYNFDRPQMPEALAGGIYCMSATMLQELPLYFPGRWNKDYETFYQMFSEIYQTYRRANGSPDAVREIETALGGRNINDILELYRELRLTRLCAFLAATRARRQRWAFDIDLQAERRRYQACFGRAAR